MANPYEDLRATMHPAIAAGVPNSPEAMALVRNSSYVPETFGGMVTKLVERGAVEGESFDEVRLGTCALLGIEEDEFDIRIKDGSSISAARADRWAMDIDIRNSRAEHQANVAEWQAYLGGVIWKSIKDPHLDEIPAIQERRAESVEIALGRFESQLGFAQVINWERFAREYEEFEALDSSRYAITLQNFLNVLNKDRRVAKAFADANEKRDMFSTLARQLEDLTGEYVEELYYIDEVEKPNFAAMRTAHERPLSTVWLAETEVMELISWVAESYECTKAWMKRDRQRNVISSVFFLTHEQKDAFFEAFPAAGYRSY